MTGPRVILGFADGVATVTLDDPDRRNALGIDTFDALDEALAAIASDHAARVVLLQGAGRAFCAGFDLGAAMEDPPLVGRLIMRLSAVTRGLRRLPQPVVVAVQGAAIAGGCAIASAADFVCASATAKLGYPVHRMGISPVVSYPTLSQAIGPGAARTLLLRGDLVDGAEARRIGLVTNLVGSDDAVAAAAARLCRTLAAHPPHAMRVTKAWLNELDGSLDEPRFDGPARGSADAAGEPASVALLRAEWSRLSSRRG